MTPFTQDEVIYFGKMLTQIKPHLAHKVMSLSHVNKVWSDLGGVSGKYTWWNNTIHLNATTRDRLDWNLGTLYHELHHAWWFHVSPVWFWITNNPLLRWVQHRGCYAVEKQGNCQAGVPDLNSDI